MLPPFRDHPHACGDKLRLFKSARLQAGSSPRVWGQEDSEINAQQAERIIPTRVGTRNLCKCLPVKHRDHPHACGDKQALRQLLLLTRGSSPRVWGQASPLLLDSFKFRIIPTRVGTSAMMFLSPAVVKDHPHACGDKMHL